MKPQAPGSFLSGVFWNTGLMALFWPLGVAVSVVLGRWLGPAGKGEYTLATLVATLLFTLLNLGIPSSISYYLAGGRTPESSLVKTVTALAGILALLAAAIAFLVDRAGWCPSLFGVPRLSPAAWLIVLALPFQFAGCFLLFVVLAQGRRILFAAVPGIGQFAVAVLVAALVLLHKLTAFTAAGALVGSQVLTAAILLGYEQHRLRFLQSPLLAGESLLGLARYSALSHTGNVLHFLTQRVDVFMVSVLVDLRAVGLYSVAYGLAELLLLLPQRLGALYLPRIAAEPVPAEKGEEIRVSCSLVLMGSVAAAAVLALLAPVAIRLLYGPAFTPSVRPFLLLLPGACALAASSLLGAYLAGAGRVKVTCAVAGLSLGFNVLLNVVLIPRYGISGAAVSSSLAYATQALLLACVVARLTHSRPLAMLTSASPSVVAGILKRALGPTRLEVR
ncbi:MAG: oligosaccharide flippase family protein [Acidobacteria bacterium]|nr:oligosaccharide flippase family protein [Acidobacteriota bacterium]